MKIITEHFKPSGVMHDAELTGGEITQPCPFCGSRNIELCHTWTVDVERP